MEISGARASFTEWLGSCPGVRDDVFQDLEVVASELLANAISGSPADGTVSLGASLDGSVVSLHVTNSVGEWVSPAERWDFTDPLRTGGRGLLIVSALVDDIDVEHDLRTMSTVVRTRRHLEPGRHADEPATDEVAELEPHLRL